MSLSYSRLVIQRHSSPLSGTTVSTNPVSPTNSITCNHNSSSAPATISSSDHVPGLRHFPSTARRAAAQHPKVLPIPLENDIPSKPDTLTLIHYEIAKLHQLGKLAQLDKSNFLVAVAAGLEKDANFDETPDVPAAFFHFQKAAQGGCVEALLAVARIHDSGRDVLTGDDSLGLRNSKRVMKFLKLAADRGSRDACYWIAQYYEMGTYSLPNWATAEHYYNQLLEANFEALDDLYGWEAPLYDKYEIKAALARMCAVGGHNMVQDTNRAYELYNEAAEEAMAKRKGKEAMHYYQEMESLN